MIGRPDPLESALRSAFNQGEPDGPECHLCGNPAGPWLPDPSGARWPSGAQMLICSRGCPEPTSSTTDGATKGTRDAAQAPTGEPTLSSDVLDLLAAIYGSLDVPYPARPDDHRRALFVLQNRAAGIRGTLEHLLDVQSLVPGAGRIVRRSAARWPVTYPAYQSPEPAPGGDA